MLRITIYATLIVILATGAASAQTGAPPYTQGVSGYGSLRTEQEKKNDRDIDSAYQSTLKRIPDAEKKKSDPWADPQLTPSGAATTPSAAAKQNGQNSGTPRPAKD
jgi:hypothetical protein